MEDLDMCRSFVSACSGFSFAVAFVLMAVAVPAYAFCGPSRVPLLDPMCQTTPQGGAMDPLCPTFRLQMR
jgi:hypothetical protein